MKKIKLSWLLVIAVMGGSAYYISTKDKPELKVVAEESDSEIEAEYKKTITLNKTKYKGLEFTYYNLEALALKQKKQGKKEERAKTIKFMTQLRKRLTKITSSKKEL